MMSHKTPQLKPTWSTGIYTGDGVIAEPKAYAIAYANNTSDRRLLTPAYATPAYHVHYFFREPLC